MIGNRTSGTNLDIGSGTNGDIIHENSSDKDYHSRKILTTRSSLCAVGILGVLGLYSFSVTKYLFLQHEKSLTKFGEYDVILRRCVDSAGGLWSPDENYWTHESNVHRRNESIDFRILCTSVNKRISWGSYKLRCNDLKRWSNMCAPKVDITVGISIEQLHDRWSNQLNANKANITSRPGPILSSKNTSYHDDFYDATIFIKSKSMEDFPQFGNKFIDLVDEYKWKEEEIPPDMHLILQTKWQGKAMYPNHTSSVVEHWYNSYPSDMLKQGYPEYIPSVAQKSSRRLQIASIWNTRRGHDPTEGGCPALKIPGVKYYCIDKVNFRTGMSIVSLI